MTNTTDAETPETDELVEASDREKAITDRYPEYGGHITNLKMVILSANV